MQKNAMQKKLGLLCYNKYVSNINIGDYIQSLAAKYFLPNVDCFLERESLNSYECEEKIKLIMNGYFMHFPENFPPSQSIEPLFVSFHVCPAAAQTMLSKESIEYMKRFAPIGCRDKNTVNILNQYGIDAYFSGCLTLTLGERYKNNNKTDKIYFVDAFSGRLPFKKIIKNFKKFHKIIKLLMLWKKQKFCYGIRTATNFYLQYSNRFSDDVIFNAEYICHIMPLKRFKSEQEKLGYAESLIKKYARAKLVVTSRIHCALPCVSLDTPVIFVTDKNGEINSEGRLGGLTDFFNKIAYTSENGLIFKEHVKKDYLPVKDELVKRVEEFIRQEEK